MVLVWAGAVRFGEARAGAVTGGCIRFLDHAAGPADHLLAHAGIGLGEGALGLTIEKGDAARGGCLRAGTGACGGHRCHCLARCVVRCSVACRMGHCIACCLVARRTVRCMVRCVVRRRQPRNVQPFGHEILHKHPLLSLAAADDEDAQLCLQRACRLFPRLIQPAVVDHRHQHLAAECGQKLHLIPAGGQHRVGLHGGQQPRHQRIDGLAGGRQLVDALHRGPAGFLAALEHGIAELLVFMPDTEFGPHAVVLRGRRKDFQRWHVQSSKEGVEQLLLVGELAGICVVVGAGQGVGHA